jgi:hypothetical protein
MSEIICTYLIKNIWRKSNHIEDRRLQKDDIVKEASANEASNQETKRTNWTQEYMIIRAKSALNEIRKLPKVHA